MTLRVEEMSTSEQKSYLFQLVGKLTKEQAEKALRELERNCFSRSNSATAKPDR